MTASIVVPLSIDGRNIQAPRGTRLLDLLDDLGIHVPRLCHDPRLAPNSVCRLCEVDIEGRPHRACACATIVEEGMVVETSNPELEQYRKTLLRLLADSYPQDVVDQFDNPFHRYLRDYGVAPPGQARDGDLLVDRTHPYIDIDMRRCIDCFRCVRICEELQGQFVWGIVDRGDETRILPEAGGALLESSCVSCGACVDTCPTGALEDVSLLQRGAPTSWQRTTCPYCGTGCEMNVGVREDRIVVVRPALDAPVSKGHLCVKGRYATDYVDDPDRITRPMIRRNGEWVSISWEEAISEAAESLLRIRRQYGPDAIGVLGSARATNEESYLTQKFARVVLETNNVDCCARVCHAPSAAGLASVFGTGAATNSFDDIERTGAFLLVGCNPTEAHPVVGARIRQRALAGVPLIVVDPRETELAREATIHLALRPGTNIPLLHALANVIVTEELADSVFIANRTEGFDRYLESIIEWTPERSGEICDVDPDLIRRAARIYANARPAICFHGLGVTEQIQGTEGVIALAHLAMLTANVGIPGAGVNPLRGQNNVQGTAVMGCEPGKLTGSQSMDVARETHERVWRKPIPASPGLDLMTMLDAAGAGRLKGMLIFGYDILLTNPDMNSTGQALDRLESVIIVDLFLTKTAQEHGTLFLPIVSSFEKDGTFMNAERRIQRVRGMLSARGEAKTDSEVIALLAERMGSGAGFDFPDASSIWDEVRDLWPAVAGIGYERLEEGGIQWPCPTVEHSGTEYLHQEKFTSGPRAPFRVIEYHPSNEHASEPFPFILNTGRSLYHFNAQTMTGSSRNRNLEPDDLLSIHPDDALRLGIGAGEKVVVTSRHGEFTATAAISDGVRPGELFTTLHHVEGNINRVTGKGRDPITHTPEYKVTAVNARRLE